jgi:hypothetical protein
VTAALYLPFSPAGPPPPPPPVPSGAAASCADLSGEWAASVLVPNYQPLRAGLMVARTPPPPAASKPGHAYYNLTSTEETHWPAVPRSGWLLDVDPAASTVTISRPGAPPIAGKLGPWANPHSNGQQLPPAAPCTAITGAVGAPTICKLPYCGESVRPVAAQQFNVLRLGGELLYYGPRGSRPTISATSSRCGSMTRASCSACGSRATSSF